MRIFTQSKNPHHVLGPTGRTDDCRKKSFYWVKIEIPPFNTLEGKISSLKGIAVKGENCGFLLGVKIRTTFLVLQAERMIIEKDPFRG